MAKRPAAAVAQRARTSAKAKAKCRAQAKPKARAFAPRLPAWGRPPAAPSGTEWKSTNYRIMWYCKGPSIAIRKRKGGEEQVGSCVCKHTSRFHAYSVAWSVICILEANALEEKEVCQALALGCS